MFHLFALGVTTLFLIGSLLLLIYGRQLGLRYMKKAGSDSMSGVPTIEGAVFALIGLLLAFTISGALQRFDERRQLVVQEANAIQTAYDRLALFEDEASSLSPPSKTIPRPGSIFMQCHMISRCGKQQNSGLPSNSSRYENSRTKSGTRQWRRVRRRNYRPGCPLALIALGNAFEISRLREGAAEKHPPQIIYIMLFGLGLGGSLLAGFALATTAAHSWIHMVTFAATLAITLYVVTDMEFPRLGLIRVENFDHFLVDLYNQMR